MNLFLLAFFAATNLSAATTHFSNSFIEFDLPYGWKCEQHNTVEWICDDSEGLTRRELLIVMAAKKRGVNDSIDAYQKYLSQPKMIQNPNGKTVNAVPKYTKSISIAGQQWVDALYSDSELDGFYTRYLATVVVDLGVVMTYSIVKPKFTQYAGLFESVVQSMRVFHHATRPGALAQTGSNGVGASLGLEAAPDIKKQASRPAATSFFGFRVSGGVGAMIFVAVFGVLVFAHYRLRRS